MIFGVGTKHSKQERLAAMVDELHSSEAGSVLIAEGSTAWWFESHMLHGCDIYIYLPGDFVGQMSVNIPAPWDMWGI